MILHISWGLRVMPINRYSFVMINLVRNIMKEEFMIYLWTENEFILRVECRYFKADV